MKELTILLSALSLSISVLGQARIEQIVPSTAVQLRDPSALSAAADGTLIVADTGHNRVLALSKAGELLQEVGSLGSGEGDFRWPRDVASESALEIWIADFGNRRVCKLSRQFDVQGSFTVLAENSSTPEQVGKIAASQQGDVFLYAEDSGQLLCYDPLFVLRASLGSNLGHEYIPRIRQLVFVAGKGIVWHSRGDEFLSMSDPLLTSLQSIPVGLDTLDEFVFCANKSKLIAAGTRGVFELSFDGEPPEVLVSGQALRDLGIMQIDDAAAASDSLLYLLESKSGSIFRVTPENQ